MTSFYHFIYRLGRRFAYCDIRMQTPSITADMNLLPSDEPSSFSLKEKLFRVLHPIEFTLVSAQALSDRVKYKGIVRTGLINHKYIPVHIFVLRQEVKND